MNRVLFRLILEYVKNQGEVSKEALEKIKEEISEMKRKDKKRLEIYIVAVALLPDLDTEIMRECIEVLLGIKKRKMILKIINHRTVMEYDRSIERIKGILDETVRQISNPKITKEEKRVYLFWINAILDALLKESEIPEEDRYKIASYLLPIATEEKLRKKEKIMEKIRRILIKMDQHEILKGLKEITNDFVKKTQKEKERLSEKFKKK
ncbi:MAG: hypothetical protein GF370_02260 [Candidatus Nealsonbacteria bacterium]|nr:hypothetical protein [Candidatus Nealsonbacteria bacterium]